MRRTQGLRQESEVKQLLPPAPKTLKDLGVNDTLVKDILLKSLFLYGARRGKELADMMKIKHPVIFDILQDARSRKLCEIQGGTSGYEPLWVYSLTQVGHDHVLRVMERDQYIGPVPVSLDVYSRTVRQQSIRDRKITLDTIRGLVQDLVIEEDTIRQLGPACNSGHSIFLYGRPGNGKTLISKRLSQLTSKPIIIPYAIEADGQVIKLFDQTIHQPIETNGDDSSDGDLDDRWLVIKRPYVVAGGELLLENLDISFDPKLKYYLAPFQMMANGGTFLIDDFGRQRVPPQDILNRWIVPLESRIDFFTLSTGKQIVVPFDVLLMLSTNLDPSDLVDEAFLRRIRYKIEVRDPTEEQYREIFRRVCEARDVQYDDAVVSYLINSHYFEARRALRACHPRDIVDQICDLASFNNAPPQLTYELIDAACQSYFIET